MNEVSTQHRRKTKLQLRILLEATQRFNHFGFEKTTMVEIIRASGTHAKTMARLFPDKTTLAKEIILDSIHHDKRRFESIPITSPVLIAVHKLLDMINAPTANDLKIPLDLYKFPAHLISLVEKTHVKMMATLLKRAIAKQELVEFPVRQTSELLNDILKGIRFLGMAKLNSQIDVKDDEIQHKLQKQKEATKLLINGLRKNRLLKIGHEVAT